MDLSRYRALLHSFSRGGGTQDEEASDLDSTQVVVHESRRADRPSDEEIALQFALESSFSALSSADNKADWAPRDKYDVSPSAGRSRCVLGTKDAEDPYASMIRRSETSNRKARSSLVASATFDSSSVRASDERRRDERAIRPSQSEVCHRKARSSKYRPVDAPEERDIHQCPSEATDSKARSSSYREVILTDERPTQLGPREASGRKGSSTRTYEETTDVVLQSRSEIRDIKKGGTSSVDGIPTIRQTQSEACDRNKRSSGKAVRSKERDNAISWNSSEATDWKGHARSSSYRSADDRDYSLYQSQSEAATKGASRQSKSTRKSRVVLPTVSFDRSSSRRQIDRDDVGVAGKHKSSRESAKRMELLEVAQTNAYELENEISVEKGFAGIIGSIGVAPSKVVIKDADDRTSGNNRKVTSALRHHQIRAHQSKSGAALDRQRSGARASGNDKASLGVDTHHSQSVECQLGENSPTSKPKGRRPKAPKVMITVTSNLPILHESDRYDGDSVAAVSPRSEQSSNTASEESASPSKEQHLNLFGHGKRWTCIALFMALLGTIFSILSRRSTEFATLSTPVEIAPIYNPVTATGMLRMEICYNETFTGHADCDEIWLRSEDIDDSVFEIARLFLNMGTVFGVFFTLLLTSSVYWESINLRPIGVGFVVAYFLQSFSMLFFDTDICAEHSCKVGSGCVCCIFACFGWIGACIATAKMDAFKIKGPASKTAT